MLYLFIIMFIIVTIFLITRLFALHKEMRKIVHQLKKYNQRETNKKIDMALMDKNMENLGMEINKLIDLHIAENRKRVNFEDEHKRAIANISHDLRTPLTSIVGYIQMAKKEDIPADERKELLSIAYERAKRLETLLNDFYELSIIKSNELHVTLERINLKNIAIEVLMSFYDQFHEKEITPITRIPDEAVYIIADKSALTRVLENLFANVFTHSDGEIKMSIEDKDHVVKLKVENHTNTLTEKDVEHIFDRFYMADQSRSGKSTGLGLSIAKSLMEKMNGNIQGQLHDGIFSITCEWRSAKE